MTGAQPIEQALAPRPRRRIVADFEEVRADGSTRRFSLIGRAAWAMGELLAAGDSGCTPIERPAPRWSHYVFLLRRSGLDVETITESHGGAYAGHHARYRLRSKIRRIPSAPAREAA